MFIINLLLMITMITHFICNILVLQKNRILPGAASVFLSTLVRAGVTMAAAIILVRLAYCSFNSLRYRTQL